MNRVIPAQWRWTTKSHASSSSLQSSLLHNAPEAVPVALPAGIEVLSAAMWLLDQP